MTFRLVAFFFLLLQGNSFHMYRFDFKKKKLKKKRKKNLERFSLLIQCGGWRCKSMMHGKKLQSQLWVLFFFSSSCFYFVVFFTSFPNFEGGGVNMFGFFFLLLFYFVCVCTAYTLYSDKTPLCSLHENSVLNPWHWSCVARRGWTWQSNYLKKNNKKKNLEMYSLHRLQ